MRDNDAVLTGILGGIIGIGAFWVYVALAAHLLLGYPRTPGGIGTALAHTSVATIVVSTLHEVGHSVTADQLGFSPSFVASTKSLGFTVLSIIGLTTLILMDAFGVWTAPMLAILFVASPGAVIVRNPGDHYDEIALGGLAASGILGLGLWYYVNPAFPSPEMVFTEVTLAYTTAGALYLTFVNSLPLPGFDGFPAFEAGGLSRVAVIILLFTTGYGLYTYI